MTTTIAYYYHPHSSIPVLDGKCNVTVHHALTCVDLIKWSDKALSKSQTSMMKNDSKIESVGML